MLSCGIDIIEISRIEDDIQKPLFCKKVFTDSEMEYYQKKGSRAETLAGMFAAKEAFAKYLKTGFRGFGFTDVEIKHDNNNVPFIEFCGAQQNVTVSISHNKTCAVAIVCGDCDAFSKSGKFEYIEKMRSLMPKRLTDANKHDCGKVFIVAGSKGMTGAAALCAYGALRCGSGLVTVGTAEKERPIVACKLTEAMTVGLPEKNGIISYNAVPEILKRAKKSNVVVFGPGIGRHEDITRILEKLLMEFEGILIIDADGINALSENINILKKKNCEVIITPHVGEMSRLAKLSAEEIQSKRSEIASTFAQKHGVCVVLKGKDTVISNTNGEFLVNQSGNCGMATGGTGDVLAGVIAAFAAQGAGAYNSAVLGAYIHGLAGDIAAEDKGIYGLIATDVAEKLPYAIKSVMGL